MRMSSDVDERACQAEATVVAGAAEMRAAYIVGRNPYLLQGWVQSVGEIAGHGNDRPWEWEYPHTLFGDSFSDWPGYFYSDLNDAMRTLVTAHLVDPAVLVEMHRELDIVCQDCTDVAYYASADLREKINEVFWPALRSISIAASMGEHLIVNGPERVHALQRLGNYIGKLLADLAYYWDYQPFIPVLRKTTALAIELFAPETPAIVGLQKLFPVVDKPCLAVPWASRKELLKCLELLDGWIIDQNPVPESVEPYIILDYRQQKLTFLGVEIPFTEFAKANAQGGLEIMRVLIRCPGTPIAVKDIIAKSNSSADAAQIYAYLARFRSVLRGSKRFWPTHIVNGRMYKSANNGFMIADRLTRRQKSGRDSYYRLDLPRFRVRFIPVA